MWLAAHVGACRLVDILLKMGAKVNRQCEAMGGATALYAALQEDADIDTRFCRKKISKIEKGNLRLTMVKSLLKAGANPFLVREKIVLHTVLKGYEFDDRDSSAEVVSSLVGHTVRTAKIIEDRGRFFLNGKKIINSLET